MNPTKMSDTKLSNPAVHRTPEIGKTKSKTIMKISGTIKPRTTYVILRCSRPRVFLYARSRSTTATNSTDVIKSTCFSKDGTKFAAGSVLKIIKI